ncbi:hypothetical protein, partial [Bacillus paranthracis]|uniref:hypothetical protein n=1 Tax=Bacillus paranthracis TaxID=2026186 RepID=UPI003D654834
EPLSLDITESGPRQQSDVKTTTDSEQQQDDNVTTPKVRQKNKVATPSVFTEEEIRVLKDMIASQKQKTPQPKGNKEPLHDRLKGLAREEKARKNIFLNKGANERLEEFCKNERVNKSDIIELALEDFIKKYS